MKCLTQTDMYWLAGSHGSPFPSSADSLKPQSSSLTAPFRLLATSCFLFGAGSFPVFVFTQMGAWLFSRQESDVWLLTSIQRPDASQDQWHWAEEGQKNVVAYSLFSSLQRTDSSDKTVIWWQTNKVLFVQGEEPFNSLQSLPQGKSTL